MFEENEREAYLNIKAPNELKEKVLNQKAAKTRISFYMILRVCAPVMAACVLLVFAVSFFNHDSLYVSVYGYQATTTATGLDPMASRASAVSTFNGLVFPISIDGKREYTLTAMDGEFLIFEGELRYVKEITVNKEEVIDWAVPTPDHDVTYQVKIHSQRGNRFLELSYNQKENIWSIRMKKTK